ncbi:5-dehydro-4-deoxyglucarate dehydratase [Bradyrhizobium sp. CCBAU 51745]|uniref:5-dehydro-4-deoxyglucarate dehydratase n=1 Tax=Bradyrhizobium sp. CCBAU 51745 TaxID=1325099 RepID=UPI002306B500|nr:5-dehydro-4-deoxyglucarate dehydratase [Bradyrhizobium sp. CCBAU 51745]
MKADHPSGSRSELMRGVLFFPVTPFNAAGEFNEEAFEQHVELGLKHRPAAVFAACGAGELHALSLREHAAIAQASVRTAAGRLPVYLGAGGPLPAAVSMCEAAARAGADGVLLLPPYLVSAPQAGLVAYLAEVAERSPIPIIAYARGNARLTVASAVELSRHDNIIGLKDGIGDMELMLRIKVAIRKQRPSFMFLNGMPTAELSASAFRALGVPTYSSGVFCFAPEIAGAFWRALNQGDDPLRDRLLETFYVPFAGLRDEAPGFAVSLLKAGLTARGLAVGAVRAPLVDPNPDQLRRLMTLIDDGLAIVQPGSVAAGLA